MTNNPSKIMTFVTRANPYFMFYLVGLMSNAFNTAENTKSAMPNNGNKDSIKLMGNKSEIIEWLDEKLTHKYQHKPGINNNKITLEMQALDIYAAEGQIARITERNKKLSDRVRYLMLYKIPLIAFYSQAKTNEYVSKPVLLHPTLQDFGFFINYNLSNEERVEKFNIIIAFLKGVEARGISFGLRLTKTKFQFCDVDDMITKFKQICSPAKLIKCLEDIPESQTDWMWKCAKSIAFSHSDYPDNVIDHDDRKLHIQTKYDFDSFVDISHMKAFKAEFSKKWSQKAYQLRNLESKPFNVRVSKEVDKKFKELRIGHKMNKHDFFEVMVLDYYENYKRYNK